VLSYTAKRALQAHQLLAQLTQRQRVALHVVDAHVALPLQDVPPQVVNNILQVAQLTFDLGTVQLVLVHNQVHLNLLVGLIPTERVELLVQLTDEVLHRVAEADVQSLVQVAHCQQVLT